MIYDFIMIPRTQHQDKIPCKFGMINSDDIRQVAESVAISSSAEQSDMIVHHQNKKPDEDNKKDNDNKDMKKETTPPADMSDLRKFMSQYLGNTIHKTQCKEIPPECHPDGDQQFET